MAVADNTQLHYPVSSPTPMGTEGVIHVEDFYDILHPIFGSKWPIAAAVIMAESGGNTKARNVNSDGSVDRGWFQINAKWHPEVSDACAYNAFCSARAAYKISNGGVNWTPWATFTSGKYRKYLGTAHIPNADDAGLFGIGRGEGADTKVAKAAGGVGAFLDHLNVIFQGGFWLRVLQGIGGLVLIGLGLVMVGKNFTPLGQVTKFTKKLATP